LKKCIISWPNPFKNIFRLFRLTSFPQNRTWTWTSSRWADTLARPPWRIFGHSILNLGEYWIFTLPHWQDEILPFGTFYQSFHYRIISLENLNQKKLKNVFFLFQAMNSLGCFKDKEKLRSELLKPEHNCGKQKSLN
jgi:hypothetical protein